MPVATDRRSLLKLGALGLAGASAPLAATERGAGFSHGVASGEPGPDRVMLWTRYAAAGDTALRFEVAEDDGFRAVVASGTAVAAAANDWCAKPVATGLAPGRWYYYRFVAPTGEASVTGRTRTLPAGRTDRYRIAVFSCSNYGFGWFNAYAHAADAGDFDLVVHLGDYFYEYKRGEYPNARQVLPGRESPLGEAMNVASYRDRFATYRSDPDLQRLHQLYPMITIWDDHESANDAWSGGAENHDPATEGDWQARKAAARQVYREWLPVSAEDWARYDIGDLATLFRVETRVVARTEPLDLERVLKDVAAADRPAALAAFRDGPLRDPARTLMGPQQEAWLAKGFKESVRDGKRWQVLAQQVVMGELAMPVSLEQGMAPDAPGWLKQRISNAVAISRAGLGWNMDAWDGYPAARERLLDAARVARANTIVLSGDSHNAWAFDLASKGKRVGVEMASHSVTSPGAEASISWRKPADLAADIVGRNPALKWCDTSRRGYIALDLTRQAATGEWRFMQSVRQKGTALSGTQRLTVRHGKRRYSAS